ncbi:hypothetical protein OS188_09555 [Xanthomarina sp. F1114]|uniref:hypothetical protein n=1 Tax=Xanthomarina sp. F1114 TaxID=2996019 RepID=UPI00225DEA1B|nr:hypothetical protein [Xanthomarina sp. F1114]MCX7548198.1 hypothetical protein [Xanthomarina sp. F1114]
MVKTTSEGDDDKLFNLEHIRREENKLIVAQAFEESISSLATIDAVISCLNELNRIMDENKIIKKRFDNKNPNSFN